MLKQITKDKHANIERARERERGRGTEREKGKEQYLLVMGKPLLRFKSKVKYNSDERMNAVV